jgi:predicted dehydrogenase
MTTAHGVAMLGTGLIGDFYTATLHGQRGRDRVQVVYSRSEERGKAFQQRWDVPAATRSIPEAVDHPDVDTVVVGLPNALHEEAIGAAVDAGKAVLCTKPLARTAEEARRILDRVESAGVFAGYLEDLAYTPKTLKATKSVAAGSIGDVLWVRSRETHPGPHSAWFWDAGQAGGGAIVDLGCHCIEIIRAFVGKGNRPAEVMCWLDTLVHPIAAEDNAIALIRFESGAVGQFEVSWTFRGGMDLRDEVAGTEGTIWLNHFLRTGFEMFTSASAARGGDGSATGKAGTYVAEKAETETGWLFPVGDEVAELGYVDMFTDMFNAMEEGRDPRETFYDGYVVNAVMDACYRSARTRAWEPVELDWRGGSTPRVVRQSRTEDGLIVVKEEQLPDGRRKLILSDPQTSRIVDRIVDRIL